MAQYIQDKSEKDSQSDNKSNETDNAICNLDTESRMRIISKAFQLSKIFDCFSSISDIAKIAIASDHATKDEYWVDKDKLYIKKGGFTAVVYDEECEFDDSPNPSFDLGL